MMAKILHGRSFKGAAAYLLHDVEDHDESNRVVWTMTRNLATRNPDTAWRVMAAVAMDAPRLKKEAGIKATGQKQKNIVKHLVLSWHPDEKATLTREDMEAAIEGALAAIGALDRQALIIAHNDTAHPHVHILINRTLENGTLLKDSKEREHLQAWALQYERQRNQTYSPNRELNAEARARGEPTQYDTVPRQIADADKLARKAANDNVDRRTALKDKHLVLARAQAARTHALDNRHREQWTELQDGFIARRRAIREAARKGQAAARLRIIETYRPLWRDLKRVELAERNQFQAREKTTLGRLSNAVRNIDTGRSSLDGERPSILSQLWRGISSSAEREAMLDKQRDKRRQELELTQRKAIRDAMLPVVTAHKLDYENAIRDYRRDRADLMFVHRGENAKNKAEWAQLLATRERDYAELAASAERTSNFNAKADPKSFMERLKDAARQRRNQKPVREQDNEPDPEQEHD